MGSTVIGCQEHKIVTLSHLLVKGFQQFGDIFVQLQIGLVNMRTASTPLVTDEIGLRETHAEHVGSLVLAQVLSLQGSDGHISGDMSAEG